MERDMETEFRTAVYGVLREYENRMIGFALVASVFAGSCGVALGKLISSESSRPDYLYGRDVNGDGREDIVAKCRSEEIVYIQQEDGTYRRLEK